MDTCLCGEPLEFMGYYSFRGIGALMKVGCPSCDNSFYIQRDTDDGLSLLPRMNQLNWLRLYKKGIQLKVVEQKSINDLPLFQVS